MHAKAKRTQAARKRKGKPQVSGVFIVPSHGRLVRRGSTEVVDVEDEQTGGRGAGEPSKEAS
jgi:hypothetical protein